MFTKSKQSKHSRGIMAWWHDKKNDAPMPGLGGHRITLAAAATAASSSSWTIHFDAPGRARARTHNGRGPATWTRRTIAAVIRGKSCSRQCCYSQVPDRNRSTNSASSQITIYRVGSTSGLDRRTQTVIENIILSTFSAAQKSTARRIHSK